MKLVNDKQRITCRQCNYQAKGAQDFFYHITECFEKYKQLKTKIL